MHALAAAMHIQGIDPSTITITLPREEWWHLAMIIESRFKAGLCKFDGRGPPPGWFTYMGFTFKPAA
jgi:hypothetical protein